MTLHEVDQTLEQAIAALRRLLYAEYLKTAHWQRVRALALELHFEVETLISAATETRRHSTKFRSLHQTCDRFIKELQGLQLGDEVRRHK